MLRSRTFLVGVPALLVLALLPLGVGGYILGLLTLAYYYAVFAMSWDLLFGFAGEVNFGPSFLIGVGAYTAALLNHYAAVADPALPRRRRLRRGDRRRGPRGPGAAPAPDPYFGLVTLVAVLLLQNVMVLFAGVTGGEIGLDLPDVLSIDDTTNYYYALGLHDRQRRHPVSACRDPPSASSSRPAARTPSRPRRSASTSPSTSWRRSASARSSPAWPAPC